MSNLRDLYKGPMTEDAAGGLTAVDTHSPVRDIDAGSEGAPAPGIALALSGGGYRAMLFHVGALWRLNEAGYLPRLERISSVSGGSITAGVLGMKWSRLGFRDGVASEFSREVVGPVRGLAARTIDLWAILRGIVGPRSVGDQMVAVYRRHLFGAATLQDLPDRPRFVINATSVQSNVLWRFMKPYMRDYRVGEVKEPKTPIAVAVAASAAFPPFLSPIRLRLDPASFTPNSGQDLQQEPYTSQVVLTDGGVYDNLGLETVWKRYQTILVSDGGGTAKPDPRPRTNWGHHTYRAINLIQSQVLSLRKRALIASFQNRSRTGTYWGVSSDIAHYGAPGSLPAPVEKTCLLAAVATRLKRLDPVLQEKIINWGYAVCDAALRRHVDQTLAAPLGFPYPDSGVG